MTLSSVGIDQSVSLPPIIELYSSHGSLKYEVVDKRNGPIRGHLIRSKLLLGKFKLEIKYKNKICNSQAEEFSRLISNRGTSMDV